MSNARNLSDLLGTGTTIATASIADDAITSAKIADDAVVTAAIADDAITSALLATDSVGSDALDQDAALKIKQVVSNHITTTLEVGSGANPDWSAAATTITPTSHTNPILVIFSCFSKSTTSSTTGRTNLRRKTNSGGYGDVGGELHLYNVSGATVANNSHFSFQRWDNPTRSAGDSLTYTLDLRRFGGSDSVFLIGSSNYPANMTLIEFEGTSETNGA